jgi:hypothetical protein
MPEQKKERRDEKPAQTAEHAQPDSRKSLHTGIIAYRLIAYRLSLRLIGRFDGPIGRCDRPMYRCDQR